MAGTVAGHDDPGSETADRRKKGIAELGRDLEQYR
jgi:hypothetical protein